MRNVLFASVVRDSGAHEQSEVVDDVGFRSKFDNRPLEHPESLRLIVSGSIDCRRREAIKYAFDCPFDPRRGAEQRAVVDASSADTVRSASEAFV